MIAEEISKELTRLGATVARVRYLRLREELFEATNPELNADQRVLVTRLEALGFRRAIVDALADLDRKVYGAAKALEFKAVMDLARTIYEEIVEDAAKKTAEIRGEPPPSKDNAPFGPWLRFLKGRGIVTDDEANLLQKLYDYLSNAGIHRLGTAPEQARVAKNMVIELALLVAGRVQGLQSGGS